MKKTRITAILIFFIMLCLLSIMNLQNAYLLPLEKEIVTPLTAYRHYGTYDYIVTLKPNKIYNKTTLEPGEGPIYTKITDHINLNFTYTFEGIEPTNITIQYSVNEEVQTPRWKKQIKELPPKTTNITGSSGEFSISNISIIDVSSIQNLVNQINQETGLYITTYNVTITTELHIEMITSERTIDESFTPKLAIEFTGSTAGGQTIRINDLEHVKSGEITKTETIFQPWVLSHRYLAQAMFMVVFVGLAIIAVVFVKSKPAKSEIPKKPVEEIISPYEEIIAEATKEPTYSAPTATVTMKTIEDLIVVADSLAKPVIHTHKPPETHIFYVIDGTTRYEFTTTAPSIAEKIDEEEEIE